MRPVTVSAAAGAEPISWGGASAAGAAGEDSAVDSAAPSSCGASSVAGGAADGAAGAGVGAVAVIGADTAGTATAAGAVEIVTDHHAAPRTPTVNISGTSSASTFCPMIP